MSVTVRPTVDRDPDRHEHGTDWTVSDAGHLLVIATDRTVAEYPAGQWACVTRDHARKTTPTGEAAPASEERPPLTAASHLASSERRWSPHVEAPATVAFGFARSDDRRPIA